MHRVATHLRAEPRPVQRHRLGEQADAGVGSNAVAALPSGEQALVYLLICLRQMALAPSKISSGLPSTVAFKIPSKDMHANLMQFAIGCGFFALAQGGPLCDGFRGLLSQQRGDPMKKVVVLMVAVFAALNVAGCAGKGKTPVAPPPPPPITK